MRGINVNTQIYVNKPPSVGVSRSRPTPPLVPKRPVGLAPPIPNKTSEDASTKQLALSSIQPVVQTKLPSFVGSYYN
jgi:hypothetical protein